jgi:uncharacterized protein YhjY with autotransporter beta-barrel domain
MKLFLRSILFFAVASFAPLAFGSPDWTNTGPDNNFNNGLNWANDTTTGTVPGPSDSAHIFPGFITTPNGFGTDINVFPGGATTITINATTDESVESVLVSSNFDGFNVANGVLNFNFISTTAPTTLTIGADGASGAGMVITGNSTVNYVGNLQLLNGTLVVGTTSSFLDPSQVTGSGVLNIGAGTFTLSSGTSFIVGQGITGTVTQAVGSTVTTAGNIIIGDEGGSGTYTQLGGSLVLSPTTSAFEIAEAGGTGTYNLEGGTATFNTGVTIGGAGTVNQTGGTFIIPTGQTLDLSTLGSSYILGGGTLQIGNSALLGLTSGEGTLNFAGGTLQITSTNAGTFTDPLDGTLTGTNSTIDAVTLPGVTTVIMGGNLSGTGGITFEGTAGTTTFQFTGINTYTGPTTIASGTLNATGANITNSSALNMGPTGTLNLTLAPGGLTYAGSIGGTGAFNVFYNATSDTFEITGLASNFTGVTTLTGGGTFEISNGTLGNISGGGASLVIGDNAVVSTGTVNIGTGSFAGGTTVNAGFTLNATSLTSDIANAGTLNVTGAAGITGNVTTNSGTLNTTIITGNATNSGTLNATGAGGIGGSVANSGTLTTTVIAGSVTSNTGVITSGLVGDTLNNGMNGTFITTSPINTTSVGGNITNSGILASSAQLVAVNTPPPNATFTIGGTLTQTSTGTLDIRVNGNTADYFKVNGVGMSTLMGNVSAFGSTAVGTQSFVVLDATGGITGGSMLTPSSATALFETDSVVIASDTVTITTTQLPISTYALTPNQIAVANAIDNAESSALKTLFNQIPTDAAAAAIIPGALDQLSPESLQYARNIAFENSTFLAERMNGVDADLRAGYGGLDTNAVSVVTPGFDSGLGRSLGSLLASDDPAFHQSAPNGVNYYPGGSGGASSPSSSSESTPTPTWDSSTQVISDSPNPYIANQNPSSLQTPRMSEFIGGDVILADLNQNQNTANSPSSKASYTAGDVTAGISFRMNSHLAAGVLIDYNHTDATTDSSGSKTTVDSYSPGLFATYFDHGFYVNGLASFGYNTYSNTRDIGFVGATASSHPNGQQYVGDLDFGYDFHPAKNWVVGPTVGLTYTHLNIDSFTETGASPADLTVDSQSADSLRSRLGGHVIFQTNTGDVLLQPNITAMWQHEYLDSSSGITSSFSDFSSSPFTIQTAAPSRDSALIGVGLTATLSTSMALYLNYFADIGASDYYAQSVVGGVKARF